LCCDSYASDYNIIFNASKSSLQRATIESYSEAYQYSLFAVISQPIEMVKQWSHLGHIISHDMDE